MPKFTFKPDIDDLYDICIKALVLIDSDEAREAEIEFWDGWLRVESHDDSLRQEEYPVTVDAQVLRTALTAWMEWDPENRDERVDNLCRALDDHLVTAQVQAQAKPKKSPQEISESIKSFAEQEQARLAEVSWTNKRDAIFREIFGV